MVRPEDQTHRRHARQRGDQAQTHTQRNVGCCARILPALDQADCFCAECGESGEAAAEAHDQQGSQLERQLHVQELAHKYADQKTSRNVYNKSADRKPARTQRLNGATHHVA